MESKYPAYILLISYHVSGIITTTFPVMHIGCCPHTSVHTRYFIYGRVIKNKQLLYGTRFQLTLPFVLVYCIIPHFIGSFFFTSHMYLNCALLYLLFHCHSTHSVFARLNFERQMSETPRLHFI